MPQCIKELTTIKNLTPLRILMQAKISQTSGANSEHKHSKIERFSTLNKRIISYSIVQLSKLKRLRHCQCQLSVSS